MTPPKRMSGVIVTVTGVRRIAAESQAHVAASVEATVARGPAEIRFGGAPGVDTLALEAAAGARDGDRPELVVYAPATRDRLPRAARAVAEACADRFVELGGHPGHRRSYLDRNLAMLDGADLLLAFTDGRRSGGTAHTIREAERRGLPVERVAVVRAPPPNAPELPFGGADGGA